MQRRLWKVSFYAADGTYRDAYDRYGKVKPTTWAHNRLAKGETCRIETEEEWFDRQCRENSKVITPPMTPKTWRTLVAPLKGAKHA